MREQDQLFVDLLNRAHFGEQTASNIDTLRTRILPYDKVFSHVRKETKVFFRMRAPEAALSKEALKEKASELIGFEGEDMDSNGRPLPSSAALRDQRWDKYLKIQELKLELKLIAKLMRNMSAKVG